VELASAWLSLEAAAGTDLASPDLLDESIRQHLQSRKKIRLDHGVQQITARHPTGEEAALLRVAADAPIHTNSGYLSNNPQSSLHSSGRPPILV